MGAPLLFWLLTVQILFGFHSKWIVTREKNWSLTGKSLDIAGTFVFGLDSLKDEHQDATNQVSDRHSFHRQIYYIFLIK